MFCSISFDVISVKQYIHILLSSYKTTDAIFCKDKSQFSYTYWIIDVSTFITCMQCGNLYLIRWCCCYGLFHKSLSNKHTTTCKQIHNM